MSDELLERVGEEEPLKSLGDSGSGMDSPPQSSTASPASSSAGSVVQVPTDQLVAMMLAGENHLVLKYLRKLPKEQFQAEKQELIKNLEKLQKSKKQGQTGVVLPRTNTSQTSAKRSKSKNENEEGKVTAPRRKINVRKRIHSSPPGGNEGILQNVHSNKPKIIDKYELNEELGKGQFAVVYKGFNIETGERVAVKYIDKDAVDVTKLPTLRREAELLQKLNHSNIVKIYHFEESKKKLALVLEFMDRGSLQQILKKYGTLPEETVSVLTRESLNGLNYLHQEGIIHRDIKAGNILINEKAQVKLADFGTAKPEDQNKNFTVIGTPYWMAPEVIELTGVGAKSDVWSLGCTVLELLIGHPPYFDLSTMQALFLIVEDDHPPIPPGLSKELEHFLLQCFIKDPKRRPSAQTLLSHPWILKNRHITYTSIDEILEKAKHGQSSNIATETIMETSASSSSSGETPPNPRRSDKKSSSKNNLEIPVITYNQSNPISIPSPKKTPYTIPNAHPHPHAKTASHSRENSRDYSKETKLSLYELSKELPKDTKDSSRETSKKSTRNHPKHDIEETLKENLITTLCQAITERDALRVENQNLRKKFDSLNNKLSNKS